MASLNKSWPPLRRTLLFSFKALFNSVSQGGVIRMREYTSHNFRLVQEYLLLMLLSLYPWEIFCGNPLVFESRYLDTCNSARLVQRA